jgi:HPr kinase/phosphorylase
MMPSFRKKAGGTAQRRYSDEPALSLKRFYDDLRRECLLTPCMQPIPDAALTGRPVHRPGLALAGFVKYFPRESLQLIGEIEFAYLCNLSTSRRRQAFEYLLSERVPAVVFAHPAEPEPWMVASAAKKKVALFTTRLPAEAFYEIAGTHLHDVFAERTSVHGTLVLVHGVGILYVGKSGIGKSECALDLVCKGHALVSDDVVHIVRTGDCLVGECNEILGHHMEIRGIGIVNVKELCGMRSVRPRARIDVQMELVEWNRAEYLDRSGLDEKKVTILGVPIPHLCIPVSPGKNISAISEILALRMELSRNGKSTIKEFDKKLILHMKNSAAARGRE